MDSRGGVGRGQAGDMPSFGPIYFFHLHAVFATYLGNGAPRLGNPASAASIFITKLNSKYLK